MSRSSGKNAISLTLRLYFLTFHLPQGTLDLDGNIFNDQFNIALDPKSAEYVLRRTDTFYGFIAVPSQTSKAVTFSAHALKKNGLSGLARWILCFNRRHDPAEVSNRRVTFEDKECENTMVELPDLAMFLFGYGILTSQEARVQLPSTKGGPLLFKISDEGIPILEPGADFKDKPVDLGNFLSKNNKDGITVRFDI